MLNGLCKYFPADRDKLKWFSNCQILLTPPQYFNDPWDFLVRFEPYTEVELREQAWKIQRPIEEIRQVVKVHDFLTEESRDYQQQIGNTIGVVSLAENPFDRIMWAHYAESHHGFVAEFAHDETFFKDGFSQRVGPFGPAAKVEYLKPGAQQPECKRDVSNIGKILWSKHSGWHYEQEWRVIQSHLRAESGQATDGTSRSLIRFKPRDLIRVVFGLRTCPTVETLLTQMLRQPEFRHVRIERACIDPVTNDLVPSKD